MGTWLKKILPEKIPSLGAVLYAWGPARMFAPHYRMIAGTIALNAGDVLVDVGTGPGMLPIAIATRLPQARIIGIDLSEKMIAIATERARGIPNVSFQVMNASRLRFGDNELAMVISTGSMHHWKEPVPIINEIYRCLKPGAEAWIYDGYGDVTSADIAQSIQPLFPGFPPHWFVRRLLRIHGFRQAEYDTIIKDMIAQTAFRTCSFVPCGVMMNIRLKKV